MASNLSLKDKIILGFCSIGALGAWGLSGYGIINQISNMMQNGVNSGALTMATGLGAVFIPLSLGMVQGGKLIMNKIRNKNNNYYDSQSLEEHDYSKDYSKDNGHSIVNDHRFEGNAHPTDVIRQPPKEYGRPRDDVDSREL